MNVPVELHAATLRFEGKSHEYSRLSRKEVAELFRCCRDDNNKHALRHVVRAHMRYAIAIALKYRDLGAPLSALITQGERGIVCAVMNYDFGGQRKFATYVTYWIRVYVLDYIISSWHLDGLDGGDSEQLRSKLLFRLRREKVRIANAIGNQCHATGTHAEST